MKFIGEKDLRNRNGQTVKIFARPQIVKWQTKGNGYITLTRTVSLPKKYVGRKVRVKIELLPEEK